MLFQDLKIQDFLPLSNFILYNIIRQKQKNKTKGKKKKLNKTKEKKNTIQNDIEMTKGPKGLKCPAPIKTLEV